MAVSKWRHYLLGNRCIIRTYHQSLRYLFEQPLHTSLQYKWLSKLLGLDYKIQYKKGSENIAADSLSRISELSEGESNTDDVVNHVAAIYGVQPVWIQQALSSYEEDEECQELMRKLVMDTDFAKTSDYSLVQGF